jgi:hypothetical protein
MMTKLENEAGAAHSSGGHVNMFGIAVKVTVAEVALKRGLTEKDALRA